MTKQQTLLLSFFSSVFITDNGMLPNFPCPQASFMTHCVVSAQDIIIAIRHLNKKSCPGPDTISPIFVSNIACFLASPLAEIFNSFLLHSYCPPEWKESVVIPIYKGKGDRTSTCNYRPISLVNCFSKMFEYIVSNHIRSYLHNCALFLPNQFGFVEGKGITEQYLECLDLWCLSVNSHSGLHCVYFDIAKAFDTVSHSKLLYKLRCIGFSNEIIDWIETYLQDRTFRVRVNNCYSTPAYVSSGVPQGSTLGPLLFIIYINDLAQCVKSSSMLLFADDCKLIHQIRTHEDSVSLQLDIDAVVNWYSEWQLALNVDKSCVLCFF